MRTGKSFREGPSLDGPWLIRRSAPRKCPRRAAPRPAGGEGGFTLVEVLLALVLLAALLTSINYFVFSITEAWTKHHDEFVFVQHTRAVTRHLDEILRTSTNASLASNPVVGGPAVAEMKTPEGATEDLLAFDLPMGDRLFTWPSTPLPEVQCALAWRKDDGLVLYWKSRLEADFATGVPRMAVLSPFVTELSYDYYDTKTQTWSNEDVPQKDSTGAYEVPSRIRLKFERKGRDYEEIIVLSTQQEGLPAY